VQAVRSRQIKKSEKNVVNGQFLQEPGALDPLNTQLVKDVMRELRQKGAAIMMSTHQMHQVEELCDRIMLIDEGRDVLYSDLNEIRRCYASNAVLVQGPDKLPAIPGVEATMDANQTIKPSLSLGTAPQDLLRVLVAFGFPLFIMLIIGVIEIF
jgi:ABC-2 type transport system ATP-binding protein